MPQLRTAVKPTLRRLLLLPCLTLPMVAMSAPEIFVTGNMAEITDGSVSPTLNNATDLGDIYVGNPNSPDNVTYTPFIIYNIGDSNLTLDNAVPFTFTGPNAASFAVSQGMDYKVVIPPGERSTFQVNAGGADGPIGQRNATINIFSNDQDEPVFNFALRFNAINEAGPLRPDFRIKITSVEVKPITKKGITSYKVKAAGIFENSSDRDVLDASPSAIQYSLSPDPLWNGSETAVSLQPVKKKAKMLKNTKVKLRATLPDNPIGLYLLAEVDPVNVVPELTELNNRTAFQILPIVE